MRYAIRSRSILGSAPLVTRTHSTEMLLGLVCRAAIYSVELVTASRLTATLFLGAVVRRHKLSVR